MPMGPLVPDIISSNLNLIMAFVIGILFGMILEQAGFSTSKKLVGLFYGYDFTVLRVFFTAGVVAMTGVMGLKHFGLLDINLVYINPTFLWSAIIGGLIMGLGFVLGGFCPGTSVCAAAIGKLDAMIFIGGSFIGVLVFAEGYPFFEGLYKAKNLGNPRIFETFNIPETMFAFLMTLIAIFAFLAVSVIERKVNGLEREPFRIDPYRAALAAGAVVLVVLSLAFTDKRNDLLKNIEDKAFVENYRLKEISPDQFALCIMRMEECDKFQIFDFRDEETYRKMSFPKSTLFTLENLFEKEPVKLLNIKHRTTVFIADDEMTERKMAVVATELGFKRIAILKGGVSEFSRQVLEFSSAGTPATNEEEYIKRFRTKAKQLIPVIIENNKPQGGVKKTQKRVIGGC